MKPKVLAYLILTGYLFILVMSAAHLASWFALTSKGLPSVLPWGLAGVLEGMVFLFALVTHLYPGASKWSPPATYFALGLVWLGNYRSMRSAYQGEWALEPLVQSLFVVMSVFAGKVAGELLRKETESTSLKEVNLQRGEVSLPQALPDVGPSERNLVRVLLEANPTGLSVDETAFFTGLPVDKAMGALEMLRREGAARLEGGRYFLVAPLLEER
jgi:hypothetical protein